MLVLQSLLAKAAVAISSSLGARRWPASATGLISYIARLFLGNPGSVGHVLVFRGEELVFEKHFGAPSGNLLKDPEVKVRQVAVVRALLDFMRDSFSSSRSSAGAADNCISYKVGRWWLMGLVEGDYTLIAVTQNIDSSATVEKWLKDLAHTLPV